LVRREAIFATQSPSNFISGSFTLVNPAQGNLCAPELRSGLFGNQANLCCEPKCADPGLTQGAWIPLFLAVFALVPQVWSQQDERLAPPASHPATNPFVPASLSNGIAAANQNEASSPQLSAGQASPGSVHGTIVGRDGAVLEGARVSLAQPSPVAPSETTVISDDAGRFNFTGVPPGPFTLTVASDGFATEVVSRVLHSGESYEAPAIVLLLASAASEVRVTASQVEIAQEQIKVEETQRILGVIPNFYVSYVSNPAPLTAKQKIDLAWRTAVDPVSFLFAGAFAGVEQANNTFVGYGQGVQGYTERFGANYADNFIGTMIGSALLPSLLKQDPRYFYKGTGTTHSRVLYAIANAVVCKGDNGHWQVDYSGILGGLAAGGISNLYYPASDRSGVTLTFENALVGMATGAAQNLFQEFVIRHLTPKLRSYTQSQP
jgi:hypothetical protein